MLGDNPTATEHGADHGRLTMNGATGTAEGGASRICRGMAAGPIALVILGLALISIGCGGPQTPPTRYGSLPYPGPFTFHALADPADLGTHRYGGWSLEETGRGLIYTERGGFIDVAHVRITVDWTWFYYQHLHAAMEQRQENLDLPMNKGSRLRVKLRYPDGWDDFDAAERPQVLQQLALRMSQELAWILGAWHEIASWYGYSRLIIASERASAFTHDDTFSHLIGLYVAEQAINHPESDFEQAVTAALDAMLRELGAVGSEQTDEMVQRVRGLWWDDRGAIRRYLELSLDGSPQRPWLAPLEPGGPGRLGEPFELPRLGVIAGHDFGGFYEVRIAPFILQGPQIRAVADANGSTIDPFVHFPPIMEAIREELLLEYGPDADQP
jgi:hypothetical protein